MPDDTTLKYVFDYNGRFMTDKESAAWRHAVTSGKFQNRSGEAFEHFTKNGWATKDPEVLKLLDDGFEQFWKRTAERILKDNAGVIFFNKCPKCEKLARTPAAKQCRYCGYTWHDNIVGTFQIASAFQVTGRYFNIAGDVLSGKLIKIGMRVDLTAIGLTIKPTITDIGHVLHTQQDVTWEDVSLGLSEISDFDKEYLKSHSPFLKPIPIENNAG